MPSSTFCTYLVALYNLTPNRELTQPWYESSPWGDSDQHAAYIPCRASTSAVLPYIFAGTHFTYPQRDGRLSQPVECSTAGPSHVSHYGTMPAGWSPIHVLNWAHDCLTSVIKHKMFAPCYVSPPAYDIYLHIIYVLSLENFKVQKQNYLFDFS